MTIDNKASQPVTAPKVYEAINAVQRELAITGIAKNKQVTSGGNYMFRGIDDVYNALSVLMAKHNLIISPRFTDRVLETRVGAKSYTLYFTTLVGHFDFISSIDGSKHTVTTYGEALDSGDKGTNKAMSIAYKYACFQVFAIPTEATAIDPDNEVHPKDVYQNQNANNQTTILDVSPNYQQNNYLPSLPAPMQAVALNIGGKSYDKYKRRIFNADQFKSVLASVKDGKFSIEKFKDSEKYFYSEAQINALLQLEQA